MLSVEFQVNKKVYSIEYPQGTLLKYLREELGLMGSKNGCNEGHCGSCTVIVNGKARRSCVTKLSRLDGAKVETIENLSADGKLHPIQLAFIQEGAFQCGFCTPGMIMSAKALLDCNLDPTEQEIRQALKHNFCRCTGYVSIIRAIRLAAGWLKDPAAMPELPKATGVDVVGVSVPRVDSVAKVTGAPIFADDLSRENMLYGKLVHGNEPYAEVVEVDTAEAAAFPGVAAVLTARDIPGENIFGNIIQNQPVLAGDVIRYIGDPVAVVYAETEEQAAAAAELVKVKLKPLQGIFTAEEALQEGAPRLHPNGNILNHVTVKKGDVEKGFAASDLIIEDTYYTQCTDHAYLEPESALAEIDEHGKITVWTGSQSSHAFRKEIARALGFPEEKVRVIFTATGGAFGGKEEPVVQIHAALGALKTGRPVKMTVTRRESLMKSTKRHPEKIHIKHGVSKDGKLLAVEARILSDTGPYASLGMPVIFRSTAFATGPYVVPNVYSDGIGAYTNNAIGGAFRGFGSTQITVAYEIQMDRLARKLGIDPIEFRLKNALKAGDTTGTGHLLEEPTPYVETLLAIKEALSRLDLPPADQRWKTGIGIASSYKNVGLGTGLPDGAGATVELTADGKVLVLTGASEVGQGSDTIMSQIAADAGGFPFSVVTLLSSDTDRCLNAGMTTASRQTYVSGNAIYYASVQLSKRLKDVLASEWGTAADNITFDNKGALSGARSLAYKDLHRLMTDKGLPTKVDFYYDPPATAPLPECSDHKPGDDPAKYRLHFAYCYGTHAAIVQVDVETGKVEVLKIIAAHEVGTAIHPLNVRAQVEGSVVMGIGYGLMEEYKLEKGRVVTDTLKKINFPYVDAVPEIEVIVVEQADPDGPFGAKGLGELPVNPVAPAILNGIYDAVGVRLTEIPATPDRVLKAIQEKTE